ncbi:5665_t:CDS:1, partial [Racocetra persica]
VYVSIVDSGVADNKFKADKIPLCVSCFKFSLNIKNNLKIQNDNIYFSTQYYTY